MNGAEWYGAFMLTVQNHEMAAPLREAAQKTSLGKWTETMTAAVTETCRAMGWQPVAKGSPCDFLPEPKQEYLGIDVMAFDGGGDTPWKFPVAVFELENSPHDDRVAYSLWKVMCIRSRMKVMICYRKNSEDGNLLVQRLKTEVIDSMGLKDRYGMEGDIVIIVGTKDETPAFPYGFFKCWALDKNTGKFVRQ